VNTLHMSWCLDCHRNPEKYVRPADQIYSMTWVTGTDTAEGNRLVEEYHIRKRQLSDCSVCHR